MGSGWSEEAQAPQSQLPPPPPSVHGNATSRSDELNANSIQTSKDKEKPKAVRERAADMIKLPHGFESIVKDADLPVDRSSMDKLYEQLCEGIFLNKSTKKYWVDKKSNSNCFMLFPRALSITWAEEGKLNYWKWNLLEEASKTIQVAELLKVCWLELHGKIKTAELSPGILYEVAFVIMIKDPSYGWDVPVNVRLSKADGTKLKEHKENLMEKPKGQWVEIPVGDFIANRENNGGEMEFSMFEYEGGMWKTGLIVKGVVIRPKNMSS